MRVFVTGTGRCGTVTFSKACSHIKNFTSAHESDWEKCPPSLIDYPDNHIEVSPHLVYFIPLLRLKYPNAKWVHLVREKQSCVESIEGWCAEVMKGFGFQWWGIGDNQRDASEIFYDSTIALCEALLPPGRLLVTLGNAKLDWRLFWGWIEAQGDFDAALAEWDIRHNARIIDNGCSIEGNQTQG